VKILVGSVQPSPAALFRAALDGSNPRRKKADTQKGIRENCCAPGPAGDSFAFSPPVKILVRLGPALAGGALPRRI